MRTPTLRNTLLSSILTMGLPFSAPAQEASLAGADSAVSSAQRERASSDDYVLQPQDALRVYVFQEEEINKQGEVSISGDHTITLPLIGTISLRGQTVREAEEMIRKLYDKDFLVNPQVTVVVLKYSDRSVNIIGAVNNAGRVQFPQERGLTIVDAITLAGGQSRLADLKRVKLTRKGANGEGDTVEINVDAIMKGGARESVHLQVGDVVFVPERIL